VSLIRKPLMKSLLVLVVISILVAALGATYQRIASASDQQAYPPVGSVVSVQDRDRHLYCTGEGSPTVILENGVGGNTLLWAYLQPALAASTRVCSYDRAGYGWSSAHSGERTAEQMAQELHALLGAAAIEPPYILVGHSFGGIVARSYVRLYAEEVVGLVLLDAAHPNQFSPDLCVPGCFPADAVGLVDAFYGILPTMARLGGVRLLVPTGLLPLPFFAVPAEFPNREALLASLSSDAHSDTILREWTGFRQSAAFVNASADLGDLPLRVITVLETYVEQPLPGQSAAVTTELWQTLQADLLSLSTDSEQMVLEDATHFSLLVNPDHAVLVSVVIQELMAVLREDG
jgi:pimeloyl-ACP methyl ester carboxylesterase